VVHSESTSSNLAGTAVGAVRSSQPEGDRVPGPERPERKPIPGARWQYVPSGKRDLRLDLLRGICIAIVLIDHVKGWSPLLYATGGASFFVTAAEGFACISGLTFGRVYRPLLETKGMRAVWLKATKRGIVLYLVTVASNAVLYAGGILIARPWATSLGLPDIGRLTLGVLTFQQMFPFTKILALYSILIPMAPLGIFLLGRGQTALLLLFSWSLYAAFQAFPLVLCGPLPQDFLFHPLAYQVLFFSAMTLGYHTDDLRRSFDPHRRRQALGWSAAAFAALLLLFRASGTTISGGLLANPPAWVDIVFGRDLLRPGRVLASGIVLGFAFLLVDYAWKPLERVLGWLFLPIGRRPLYCYAVHIPAVAVLNRFVSWSSTKGIEGVAVNMALQLSLLIAVWILVRLEFFTWVLP
jgi:hypothetical protein